MELLENRIDQRGGERKSPKFDFEFGRRSRRMGKQELPALSFAAVLAGGTDQSRFPEIALANKTYDKKEGVPAITFSAAEYHLATKRFEHSLVAKFQVGRPTLPEIRSFMVQNWKLQGKVTISSIWDDRHIVIILDSEVDANTVLASPLRRIGHTLFRLFRWTPGIKASKEETWTTKWLRFPGLPIELFDKAYIRSIVNSFAMFVDIDERTKSLTGLNYARACAELDVQQLIPEKVWINITDNKGFFQPVVVEGNLDYCLRCLKHGHKIEVCRKTPSEKPVGVATAMRDGFNITLNKSYCRKCKSHGHSAEVCKIGELQISVNPMGVARDAKQLVVSVPVGQKEKALCPKLSQSPLTCQQPQDVNKKKQSKRESVEPRTKVKEREPSVNVTNVPAHNNTQSDSLPGSELPLMEWVEVKSRKSKKKGKSSLAGNRKGPTEHALTYSGKLEQSIVAVHAAPAEVNSNHPAKDFQTNKDFKYNALASHADTLLSVSLDPLDPNSHKVIEVQASHQVTEGGSASSSEVKVEQPAPDIVGIKGIVGSALSSESQNSAIRPIYSAQSIAQFRAERKAEKAMRKAERKAKSKRLSNFVFED